jgi:hypothetical protein
VLLDNIVAEVSFLTDDRVCTLCRVLLLDNNGATVPFLTAGRVCMLGRLLPDNDGGEEEEGVKAAESVE